MNEVRRCHHCKEPAAICVRRWQPAGFFGQALAGEDPRRDFRCQACGEGFAVEPWKLRLLPGVLVGPQLFGLGLLLIGVGLLSADAGPLVRLGVVAGGVALCGLMAAYIRWSVRPAWVAQTRPVVADAVAPELRLPYPQPVRRCTCGQVATCVGVSMRRSNMMPAGTLHRFACEHCGNAFAIASPWGITVIAGLSLGAVILAPVLATAGGGALLGNWVAGGVSLVLGVAGCGGLAFRMAARLRHPVVASRTA